MYCRICDSTLDHNNVHAYFACILIAHYYYCTDAEILSFEKMKRDPQAAVNALVDFLCYELSDDVVLKIVEQTKFDDIKLNPTANNG